MQNQQASAMLPSTTQHFYDQNRRNNCQSDIKLETSSEQQSKTTFIPIVQTGRPVMTQNRLVTEL
jgi:hypothetical protein